MPSSFLHMSYSLNNVLPITQLGFFGVFFISAAFWDVAFYPQYGYQEEHERPLHAPSTQCCECQMLFIRTLPPVPCSVYPTVDLSTYLEQDKWQSGEKERSRSDKSSTRACVNIRMTRRDWMCDECVVTDAGMSYSQWHTSLSISVVTRTQGAGGHMSGVQSNGHGAGGTMLKCVFLFITQCHWGQQCFHKSLWLSQSSYTL